MRRKIDVLHRHCDELGRDRAEIQVPQLSSVITAANQRDLDRRVASLKATNEPASSFINRTNAGTHEQHIDRFGRLVEAGVDQVIVSMGDIGQPDAVAEFAPIIESFTR